MWNFLVWGWVASEIYLGVATRTRRSEGALKDRGSMATLWVTITLAMTAAGFIRGTQGANFFADVPGITEAAFVVLIAGLVIRWTAILSLGKAFSVNVAIRSTQKVFRGGLYRWLRHPSYTGMMLAFLAVAIQYQNWICLLVTLLPITAALLYRIQVEEIALNEAFGAEYAEYSRKTKRLIPWIY
ncbi:MAG: isoprenylcysteine carboxylmethyltransferase family protein [Terracidiphilus sp.]